MMNLSIAVVTTAALAAEVAFPLLSELGTNVMTQHEHLLPHVC